MGKKLGIWYKNTKKSPNIQIAKMQMNTMQVDLSTDFSTSCSKTNIAPSSKNLATVVTSYEEVKKLIPNSNDDATIWKLFKFASEVFFSKFRKFQNVCLNLAGFEI